MAKDMSIGLGLNLWIGWTFNSYTLHMYYRIAGYFRGVLIFVIFVVNPGDTKFSTHEIFHSHCSSVYTC